MLLLTTAFLSLLALVILYYYMLAAVGLCPKRRSFPLTEARSRFGILIPAHNEEDSIEETIRSCLALDYPSERFRVLVIADNCSDRTAELARAFGVEVLERHDPADPGKGPALAWGFDRSLTMGFDALVVLDADCCIDRHALHAFDRELESGAPVLQANYVVSNPDESALSFALAVGNIIENELFYAPKNFLGLAVFLRGTGMVLHRSVLEQFPWRAHSVTEDVEYSLQLIKHGIPIRFVEYACVRSAFPVTNQQLRVQRGRWGAGTVGAIQQEILGIIVHGLWHRNIRLLDAGWTLLVAGRSLLPALAGLGLFLSVVTACIRQDTTNMSLLILSLAEVMLVIAYFGLGIWLLGLTRRRSVLLAAIPSVMIGILWASLRGLAGIDRGYWRRTPRTHTATGESR